MLPECNYQFMSDCLQIRVGIKLTGTRVDDSTPQTCENITLFFVLPTQYTDPEENIIVRFYHLCSILDSSDNNR